MKKITLQRIKAVLSTITAAALMLGTFGIATPAAFAATAPTTNPATSITATDATLNGTNGDTDATATAFWVSTSTFTPVGGASPTLPANVYSTGGLPAVASSTAFSAPLSSATIPAGLLPITAATTYYFVAWSYDGTTWSPGAVLNFTTVSAPAITSVVPTSGTTAGGTPITITGTDFASGATVTIGGTAATSVVVASSTSITAVTPAGIAGAQDVIVSNTDTGTVTSTGGFTYVAPVSGPTVTSLSPASGTTTAATAVTITGTNFTGATAVHFGTTTAAITANTDTSITATAPAGTPGVVDVTVTTSSGTSATSSADHFTYLAPSISGTVTGVGVLSVDGAPTAVQSSGTADGTYANGWIYLFNITLPTNESNLAMNFSNWTSGANSIVSGGNMRISSLQADNADATVPVLTAGIYTTPDLHMTADMSTSTPGIQVQVKVEVQIPVGTANGSYTTNYGVRSE